MGKNRDNNGIQQGAQQHAASGHGERTRTRQAEIANDQDQSTGPTGPRHDPDEIRRHDTTGRDRLFEDREQHDEAEKNSEKTRLSRDRDRHGHVEGDESSERDRASTSKRKS